MHWKLLIWGYSLFISCTFPIIISYTMYVMYGPDQNNIVYIRICCLQQGHDHTMRGKHFTWKTRSGDKHVTNCNQMLMLV